MEFLRYLYDEKCKYNCSFATMKTNRGSSEFAVVFLGCDHFLVINNYWGCVAYGRRSFKFGEGSVTYRCEIKCQSINRSTVEKILTKYERTVLETRLCCWFEWEEE